MKVKADNPVIKALQTGKLDNINIQQSDWEKVQFYKDEFKKTWAENYKDFASNVQLITRPFAQAIYEATPKLITDEVKADTPYDKSGTMIIPRGPKDVLYICYKFRPTPEDRPNMPHGGTILYTFYNGEILLSYADTSEALRKYVNWYEGNEEPSHELIEKMKDDFDKEINNNNFVSNLFKITGQHPELKGKVKLYSPLFETMGNLSNILNFMRMVEVEVKEISQRAGRKYNGRDDKYFNESDLHVKIMDSTWFTELIRSEGFKVRGHFRLQPCGQNLCERKLIWIDDFEKNGYHRRAQKDIENH